MTVADKTTKTENSRFVSASVAIFSDRMALQNSNNIQLQFAHGNGLNEKRKFIDAICSVDDGSVCECLFCSSKNGFSKYNFNVRIRLELNAEMGKYLLFRFFCVRFRSYRFLIFCLMCSCCSNVLYSVKNLLVRGCAVCRRWKTPTGDEIMEIAFGNHFTHVQFTVICAYKIASKSLNHAASPLGKCSILMIKLCLEF